MFLKNQSSPGSVFNVTEKDSRSCETEGPGSAATSTSGRPCGNDLLQRQPGSGAPNCRLKQTQIPAESKQEISPFLGQAIRSMIDLCVQPIVEILKNTVRTAQGIEILRLDLNGFEAELEAPADAYGKISLITVDGFANDQMLGRTPCKDSTMLRV